MIQFKKLTYEALEVGEEFVSDEQLVLPEDVETYAFAVDDHHPWFLEDSPFGGPIAHPTLLGNQALRMRHHHSLGWIHPFAQMAARIAATPWFTNCTGLVAIA